MYDDYGSSREPDSYSFNLIRCGRVTGRRLTKAGSQVKVMYDDRGVESDWLPVGQPASKGGSSYNPPPQLGDQVTVLHYPTGIERGVVVCSNPTLRTPSVVPRSIDSTALQALDGSYFEYDPTVGCLSIIGVKTIYISSAGQIKIVCGGDLTASVSGNLDATVSGNTTLTCGTIKFVGNLEVTGSVSVDTNLTVTGVTNLNGGGTATPHLTNSDGSGGGA